MSKQFDEPESPAIFINKGAAIRAANYITSFIDNGDPPPYSIQRVTSRGQILGWTVTINYPNAGDGSWIITNKMEDSNHGFR